MGVLRSDRVSGLGGANAINGSVFFGTSILYSGRSNLTVTPNSELDIGAGNFTIEYWFNCGNTSSDKYSASLAQSEYNGSSSNTAFNIYHYIQGFRIFNRISGGYSSIFNTSSSWTPDSWHHFAWVREGTGSSENKIYVDGTLSGSAFTNAANYTSGQHWLIGSNFNGGFGSPEYGFDGYLSNVRVSNTARYTANFTAPTTRFEKDANTILLACQSPGNILKEETGKIITAYGSTDTALPMASRISPDVGEDYGTTFADGAVFDTLSYMVPPGGTTTQRGRGRAVMGGFYKGPNTYYTNIEYLNIQSLGNSIKFGDLTLARTEIAACSSSTRALFAGGTVPGPVSGGTKQNIIDYVTIATTANAINFGDLTDTIRTLGGCSNETRGIFGGGIDDPGRLDFIDYVTIATLGDGADFGDLTEARRNISAHSSTTRGIFAGGLNPGPAYVNTIDYITIATTGDATNFGDLTALVYATTSCSNSTRGVIMGGTNPSGATNVINYVTIATTGDATDFGDITVARADGAGVASPTRGLMVGGETPSSDFNTIDYVTIATTGNASDFGDASVGESRGQAGSSDCHGGIS